MCRTWFRLRQFPSPNIMNEAVHSPLYVNFDLPPQKQDFLSLTLGGIVMANIVWSVSWKGKGAAMVVRAAGTGVEHDATVGKTVTVASSRAALRSIRSDSLWFFRVSLRCLMYCKKIGKSDIFCCTMNIYLYERIPQYVSIRQTTEKTLSIFHLPYARALTRTRMGLSRCLFLSQSMGSGSWILQKVSGQEGLQSSRARQWRYARGGALK